MVSYSVVVSTFLRPLKLERCLDSIASVPESHRPELVVVADDGQSHPEKDRIYDTYAECLDLEVIDLPYDAGLSKKRNRGIERIETEYVLLLDDDQYVPSNVHELTDILDNHPNLGAVAPFWEEQGHIKCNAANYRTRRGWVLKDTHGSECEWTETGHALYRYHHIANAAMFRTAVFDSYAWDEKYVITGEDTDFYLTHRQLDQWDFAVTPDYILQHDPGPGTVDTYENERKDIEKLAESFDYLTEKFDIKGVLQVDSHDHPDRSTAGRIVHWTAVNVVPNAILWQLRKRGVGYRIEEMLLPTQRGSV